jgi:hypothetical protein
MMSIQLRRSIGDDGVSPTFDASASVRDVGSSASMAARAAIGGVVDRWCGYWGWCCCCCCIISSG